MKDKIVEQFDMSIINAETNMPLICIYKHPADYPCQYIARLWNLQKPTNIIAMADTLEEIRESLPPDVVRLNRSEKDDPCIVETWI